MSNLTVWPIGSSFGKQASVKQWQSERLKIAIAAHFEARLPGLCVWLSGDDCVGGLVLQRRWIRGQFGNRGHARESSHAFEKSKRQRVFPLQSARYVRVIRRR